VSYTPAIGDYAVVRTNGVFGKLIRIGTLSRWNHVIVYVGDGWIVEANPKGVQLRPLSEYDGMSLAWNQHENLTPEHRAAIAANARALVGKEYSFATIFILALRILGLKILSNFAVLRYLAKKEGYICSELVVTCYDKAGISISDKPDYLTTPGDLAERLMYQ